MDSQKELVNVLCIKWGTLYEAFYVNRLYASVKRHLHRPFRFVCVTDNADGLADGVETAPIPDDPHVLQRKWPNIFIKLLIFKDGFAGLRGPTLFSDIDVVITGDLDRFFDFHPGENCIIHNWIELRKRLFRKAPDIGNSSLFRFEAGKSDYIYQKFMEEKDKPELAWKFGKGSQKFQTYAMGKVAWWPEEWAQSFKRSCEWPWPLSLMLAPREPKNCSVLAFHGHPDPNEALIGYKGKRAHLSCLPTPWITKYWKI